MKTRQQPNKNSTKKSMTSRKTRDTLALSEPSALVWLLDKTLALYFVFLFVLCKAFSHPNVFEDSGLRENTADSKIQARLWTHWEFSLHLVFLCLFMIQLFCPVGKTVTFKVTPVEDVLKHAYLNTTFLDLERLWLNNVDHERLQLHFNHSSRDNDQKNETVTDDTNGRVLYKQHETFIRWAEISPRENNSHGQRMNICQ